MELQHLSHDHPLILNVQAKDGDSSSIVCHGCREAVSGEAYECRQCDFVLHKSCAELPSKIIHFSHPQHPLTLLSKSQYDQGQPQCDSCKITIWGLMYRCDICQYDLDMKCVLRPGQIVNHEGHEHSYTPLRSTSFTGEGICYMCSSCQLVIHIDCSSHPKTDSSFHTFNLPATFSTIENNLEKIKLQHYCHKHLLQYGDAKDYINDFHSIFLGTYCALCREKITVGPIYSCDKCRCIIHKVCSEIPRNTRNALHPKHLLVLANDAGRFCSLCKLHLSGLRYRCSSECGFYLHLQCASENTFEPKNHEHTFINFKPSLFTCDGCGIDQKTECFSCVCTICQLQVHKDCNKNSFPLRLTQKMHPHELKLSYSFEVDFEFADKFCKICSKKMNSVLCMYQCNDDACAYIAHAACATSKKLEVQNTQEVDERKEIEMEEAIIHFSHPHQLIISNEEPKIDEPPKICYGCVRPVSNPFYTCDSDECTFFLHQQCAYLPKTIQNHPLHRHPLVLKDFSDLSIYRFEAFQCGGCRGRCNGFAYTCLKSNERDVLLSQCNFILDVGCGLLKESLRHESHDCLLTIKSSVPGEDLYARDAKTCIACKSDSKTGFWCGDHPDFFLDLKCASLPTSVGHECPNGIKWTYRSYTEIKCL